MSIPMTLFLIIIFVIGQLVLRVDTVKCVIGYGQRGLEASNGISWTRNCIDTDYCYEVRTRKIWRIQNLIDYPWSEYYNHYYIKGCGGAFGLPLDFHPWREIEGARRSKIGSVKVNVTFPRTITGHGGSSRLDLVYTCRRNFCSAGSLTKPSFWAGVALIIISYAWMQ